jgi:hypothetical protein
MRHRDPAQLKGIKELEELQGRTRKKCLLALAIFLSQLTTANQVRPVMVETSRAPIMAGAPRGSKLIVSKLKDLEIRLELMELEVEAMNHQTKEPPELKAPMAPRESRMTKMMRKVVPRSSSAATRSRASSMECSPN